MGCCSSGGGNFREAFWKFEDEMSLQFQGGPQDGNYVSTDNVGVSAALNAGTSADKWSIAPVHINGVNEWGFVVTGKGGDGLTYKWYNASNNSKQVRCDLVDSGVYVDSDKFILIPKDWNNRIFQIKNHETDEYVYINNNNRLKAGGGASIASGVLIVYISTLSGVLFFHSIFGFTIVTCCLFLFAVLCVL